MLTRRINAQLLEMFVGPLLRFLGWHTMSTYRHDNTSVRCCNNNMFACQQKRHVSMTPSLQVSMTD